MQIPLVFPLFQRGMGRSSVGDQYSDIITTLRMKINYLNYINEIIFSNWILGWGPPPQEKGGHGGCG
jgi:hypothetical protein